MAITEKQFMSARKGDFFIDRYGGKWEVLTIPAGSSHAIHTVNSMGLRVKIFYSEGEILNKRLGPITALNHNTAKFEPGTTKR